MSKRNNFFGSKSGLTARTTAFLAATGITDTTIANALNTMDLAAIAAGLLPTGTGAGKIKALYPFVGGTATTHKFNFVNPLDTDAAFRLTFAGGWTHSATGAKPNGTTGWADTYFNPTLHLSAFASSAHLSAYCRTNTVNADDCPIGFYDGEFFYAGRNISGNIYSGWGSGFFTYAPSSYMGFFLLSKTASNLATIYQNAVSKATNASTVTAGKGNQKIGLASNWNYQFAPFNAAFSQRELCVASMGDALSSAEGTSFYNLVQAFQTSLSRQVV